MAKLESYMFTNVRKLRQTGINAVIQGVSSRSCHVSVNTPTGIPGSHFHF